MRNYLRSGQHIESLCYNVIQTRSKILC
ncbi:hypothetical protein CJF30_00009343 [Rutstroemia sp. NJR-2017a BBW]|nr:hypothetical protein CJF30_00009343 [Rutstroemia sp. NJR-2017a BBW]